MNNQEAIQPAPDYSQGALATAEQLAADVMLVKMEAESIMSVARLTPRDPMKIVEQLKQLIESYPAAASEAIYSKPVGTVQLCECEHCGIKYEVNQVNGDTECPGCQSKKRKTQTGVKKFAEGLSIRAAESIRSVYGFTSLRMRQESLPDGKVKITGTLTDYSAGNITSDERIVSPMYRARGGQMTATPEDRFLNVVVKAEKAKLRRDVILDNTSSIIKAMFRDQCEKKLQMLVPPEVVEQKILPEFQRYGVTQAHLETILGKTAKLGWREKERLELQKMLRALIDGETTAAELLADLDDEKPVPQGDVTTDSLSSPKGGAEKTPEKTETAPPEKTEEVSPTHGLVEALANCKTAGEIETVKMRFLAQTDDPELFNDIAELAENATECLAKAAGGETKQTTLLDKGSTSAE